MGVYINGFPLPNNCGACPLRLAWCRERIYMVNRPDRCPLIPVPPHGRLIDADFIVKRLKKQIDDVGKDTELANRDREFISIIGAVSTIIPAEEGET